MLTASNSNGTYTFSYDSDGRLTNVQEPFGVSLSYSYDADGNQTQVVDSFGGTQNSVYDADGYLTDAPTAARTRRAAPSISPTTPTATR